MGHTIQLWKYQQIFVASVEKNGVITLIPGSKIHNALLPQEHGSELLQRLDGVKLKKWHFSYKQTTKQIFVWPFLTAAGKDKYEAAYKSVLSLQHKDKEELTPTQQKLLKITKKHFTMEKDLVGGTEGIPRDSSHARWQTSAAPIR